MDQLQSKFRIAELPSDPDDRHFVTALARGLEILRCFRPGEASLTNSEMAKRTGRLQILIAGAYRAVVAAVTAGGGTSTG